MPNAESQRSGVIGMWHSTLVIDTFFTLSVPLPDCRNQVLAERALEVVARRESPVPPRCRVVDVCRPRIHDALALAVSRPRNLRPRKCGDDDVADLLGGGIER